MLVIPVIDIMGGQAVAAHLGQRRYYKPLKTPLSASSCPYDVLRSFIAIYPFKVIYIADIDALQGHGNNAVLIRMLATQHPALAFWLDSGHYSVPYTDNIYPVFGTETGIAADEHCIDKRSILSLDFDADGLIGDRRWLQRIDRWPAHILIMMLDRVGSDKGPDWSRLRQIEKETVTKRLYAAGGIRDRADLARLFSRGYGGALISSALHHRHINAEDIDEWTKNTPTSRGIFS